MKTTTSALTIYNLSNPAFCEAQGLAKVFQAYADNCPCEEMMMIGFNENSGYVYIALENGISICSMLGREVEYLITNFESAEELFFDEYQTALDNL